MISGSRGARLAAGRKGDGRGLPRDHREGEDLPPGAWPRLAARGHLLHVHQLLDEVFESAVVEPELAL
ncbi:MAG: hypothetical protein ABFS46_12790, partial [Myxococcota bacterium]